MASSYMTRALRSSDPRYARILEKLGYARRDMVAAATVVDPDVAISAMEATVVGVESPSTPVTDDLSALRAEYERVVGKRPFMGWDSGKLREKIASAKSEG